MERDFLQIPDFSRDEINSLFDIADRMKAGKYKKRPLEGKSLAMIFMKSSTRTRVSFEVGDLKKVAFHLRGAWRVERGG